MFLKIFCKTRKNTYFFLKIQAYDENKSKVFFDDIFFDETLLEVLKKRVFFFF